MNHKSAIQGPIAIAGAGIGGLTLALALQRRGIECVVFERSPSLAEVGAGITLWANAIRALESIGAAEPIQRISHSATGGVVALSDGRCLVETSLDARGEAKPAAQLWTLHRAELQQALYSLLPRGCVHFRAPFERFEPRGNGVRVHFASQAPFDAPLLVGADGLRSAVRQQLLGPEAARYAGYACFRGVCPLPAAWQGVCGEFWGKGDRFGVVQIPGQRLYWFAVVSQPQGRMPPAPCKRALLERFGRYAFEVPQIIEATDEAAILYHELFDRPPLTHFSKGGVCLLGDAAHPTTPNLGQGAAMAIESAVVLSRALNEVPSLDQALAIYEQLRGPRTAQVTQTSRTIGVAAQLSNPLLQALRNVAVRYTPQATRMRQLRALVEYDAARVPLVHA